MKIAAPPEQRPQMTWTDGKNTAVHPSDFSTEGAGKLPVLLATMPIMNRTSTVLAPDVTLDGCNLKQALESVYSTIVDALRARGVTESREIYLQEIPALVFEAAVGAGWIPWQSPPLRLARDRAK